MKKRYLIGYDISDPKRLAKVGKVMSGFGTRVQYSFFHCLLSSKQKRQMKARLSQIIHDTEDQIIILPITEKQLNEVEFIGIKMDMKAEGIIVV